MSFTLKLKWYAAAVALFFVAASAALTVALQHGFGSKVFRSALGISDANANTCALPTKDNPNKAQFVSCGGFLE